ncbi:MAG TPA: substrate-binding domain-containing protein [Lachnospiraceae bacterium]|nr:substrate-binding domain-containing protein [Lachnospiraceae bacterium]
MRKTTGKLIIGLVAILILTICGWFYYSGVMERSAVSSDINPISYEAHYAMITADENSPLWNAVYQSAAKEAKADGAYLEYMKNDSMSDYTMIDFMKMAINAKVAGILVQGNGSDALKAQIADAKSAGIPVVTMMQDSTDSERVSFVGVNDYELGKTYGQEVLKHVTDNTKNILVLLDKEKNQEETSLMYTQMKDVIIRGVGDPPIYSVSSQLVSSENTFDSEESIRTILLSDNRPDILVCLNETNTESAYQALIDYNMVGKVQLVGYYQSNIIFSGIENGIISFTVSVSADELGKQAADAINEYKTMGYVSNYISVQLEVIDSGNVGTYKTEPSDSGGDSSVQ